MTNFQAIILGVLQGIAEFLPISSSGHLQVAQDLLGLQDVPLLFDVFLHIATLAAVIIYFRKKIGRLFQIFGRWIIRKPVSTKEINAEDGLTGSEVIGRKTILAIIFTTFVTGCLGLISNEIIPDLSIKVVFAGFIVTALFLIISALIEKRRKLSPEKTTQKGISIPQALLIGLAQGIGTLPGISRSGSTIAGALLVGVDRVDAGEYSFIASIPAIVAAFILELKDVGDVASSIGAVPVVIGCLTAFIAGYISLSWLMKLIKKGRLEWFACYLIPLGIIGLIFIK